jgi:secreted Zn-dependent insulinase-like peptidase
VTFAKNLQLNNVLGFAIGVQGHSHNLTMYKKEVKYFWNHMLEYFQNIEVDRFFTMKKSYIDSLSQMDYNLE